MSHNDKDDHSKSLTSHDGQPSDQEEASNGADEASAESVDDSQAHLDGLGIAPDDPA
ncbi:hypothetical protein QWJ90_08700 [Microbacterium oryzae]|uniref:hypothetical protein n=1 Tax=Microbacterium oryzae TaxID=743009 RepID=UPI0025B1B71D|nr:hypothetical protein [Microbacterium oryzae]MDN3311009.1 hypothetical protein [Microbacterium oryzae]